MTLRTATLNGRKYKFFMQEKLNGMCDTYKMNERQIVVMAKPGTQNELITLIHEMLHAENWAETEEVVERVSAEIGRALWRHGYRR